jgi:Ras-related GTP-binding protein C/D
MMPTMMMDLDDPNVSSLPRVLLMGPRRGGKTSIQVECQTKKESKHENRKSASTSMCLAAISRSQSSVSTICSPFRRVQRVVFQKMSPHETLFRLEATQGLERTLVDHTPLCRFTIWDFPGDYYGEDAVFAGPASLIFVVDAQDEPYDHVLQSFTSAVTRALEINPNIAVEVFINKVDGELFLSDESKYDCRRDVMTQVSDELADAGLSPDSIQIRYHLTSIYDHSIYEALSRVVQRLIAQLPTLENLLNVLVSTCSMEKAYLFDVVSKLYISTDSGPVDGQSIELCSDMLDVVLDVSGIYGLGPSHAVHHGNGKRERGSGSRDGGDGTNPVEGDDGDEQEAVDADSAYDSDSASVIRLSNGMVLYLKEVDTMLALVCITRAENFRKKSLINYNIGCLRSALRALVQPSPPAASSSSSPSLQVAAAPAKA